MAGRGPAPSGTASRARDAARRAEGEVTVTADDELRGPDLPKQMDWPAQTRAWWLTWRRSPQAQTFTATDWDFLLDTALLHADLWNGNGAVAAELRLRAAKFGATPEDRQRLKLAIETPKAPAAPAAVDKGRRARLLQVIDGAS